MVTDSAIAFEQRLELSDAASLLDMARELDSDIFDPIDGFEGRYNQPPEQAHQDDLPPNMLRVPVADPDGEDAIEIVRGWADGKQLQLSVREGHLRSADEVSWVIKQLIHHAANAISRRDGVDLDDTIETIWNHVRENS
ncbi:MAG: DUF5076 domain-containing protein [Parvularculaceae bacterium]|nr:DUF5076 domain-containing protein [Parvularculaceae bacterium]